MCYINKNSVYAKMIIFYTLCLIIQGSLALISSTPDVNINSTEVPLNTSDIGILEESSKLVGGTLARTTYTHHVLVEVISLAGMGALLEYCSGEIISTSLVITSGSCVIRGTLVVVTYGTNNPPADNGRGVQVSEVITHPKFERNTKKYDIALLRLSEPVTLGTQTSIVSLPTTSIGIKDNKDFEGQSLRVIGWSLTTDAQAWSDPTIRSYVDMRVLSLSECSAAAKANHFGLYYQTMSCFSNTNTAGTSAVGACRGDWGGGILYSPSGSGGAVLVGIVSDYEKCGKMTVWTRIGPVLSWVRQHL